MNGMSEILNTLSLILLITSRGKRMKKTILKEVHVKDSFKEIQKFSNTQFLG